jgi:hypothetical protein
MTGLHHLKTWPSAFNAVAAGDKTFEWRKTDRHFEEGDVVTLHEWNPETEQYTGRCVTADVGYVLRAPDFGVPEGYCAFSLIDVGDVSRSTEQHGTDPGGKG